MQVSRKSSFVFRIAVALIAMTATLVSRASADSNASNSAGGLQLPPEFRGVGVTEHLNGQVPPGLHFFDEHAEKVALGDYFQANRPILLQLGYLDCPMLCDVISKSLIDSASKADLNIGSDFEYIFVSIDPTNTPDLAGAKRTNFAAEYGKPGAKDGIHVLIGQESDIHRLADAVGFRYRPLPNGQFAHPAVTYILTPDGKISKYLYGELFPPQMLHDSLVEAGRGKISSPLEQILQICGILSDGAHTTIAVRLMRLSGILTVMVMSGAFFWLVRRSGHGNSPIDQGSSADSTK